MLHADDLDQNMIVESNGRMHLVTWDYNEGGWYVTCDLCTTRVLVGEGFAASYAIEEHISRCCTRFVWIKV